MKKKYNFPSGFEIEKPLRRKFRSERKYDWIDVLCLIVIALTVLYVLVSRVVDDQAHASYNAHKQLCDRYMGDTALTGTSAQATLIELCS